MFQAFRFKKMILSGVGLRTPSKLSFTVSLKLSPLDVRTADGAVRSMRTSLCKDSGNRTYIIMARRVISGLVLKYLNGLGLVITKRYLTAMPASCRFPLTLP